MLHIHQIFYFGGDIGDENESLTFPATEIKISLVWIPQLKGQSLMDHYIYVKCWVYSARFQCSPHIDFTRWHISTFYTFMFVSICENTAVCDRSTSGQSALTLHLLSTDIRLWSAEKQRGALPFNGGQYMPLFRIWLFCNVIWYHVGLN